LKKELNKIPQKLPDFSQIGPAYLVGGSLRDRILSRPSNDHDFAVPGNARAFAQKAAERLGSRAIELGKGNKVVFRVVHAEEVFDFSPLQGDTIEEDLKRRDFTVNGLGFDLTSQRLVDPVGGLEDLASGTIRLISTDALNADPLRMLRAFRLGAVLGFGIDPTTLRAIGKLAPLVSRTAPERIREELFKMMGAEGSFPYLEQMSRAGLLLQVLPELASCRDCPAGENGDSVFDHALNTYKEMELLLRRPGDPWPDYADQILTYLSENSRKALLKWAALLHDLGKPETHSVDENGRVRFLTHDKEGARLVSGLCSRLRMSVVDRSYIERVVGSHLHPLHLFNAHQENQLTSRGIVRFVRKHEDDVIGLLLQSLADQRAKKSRGPEEDKAYLAFFEQILQQYFGDFRPAMASPRLITGRDLMEKFKLTPSGLIGRLLRAVEEARLCGEIETREEAIELAARLLDVEGDAGIEPATPSSGGLCSIR
jgi:poly(A) polymerase